MTPDPTPREPLTSFTPRGDDGYEMVGSPLDNLKRYHAEAAALKARIHDLTTKSLLLGGDTEAAKDVQIAALSARVAELEGEADLYHRGYDAMRAADISEYLALCGDVRGLQVERDRLRAELEAIRAACEPCIWGDLGPCAAGAGKCFGCRLAALLAPKPATQTGGS